MASELMALAERNAKLVEALRPFADIADFVEHTNVRDGEIVFRLPDPKGGYWELERRHFIEARAALRAQAAAPAETER